MKNLLSMNDLNGDEIRELLTLSASLKNDPSLYSDILLGKTLAMLFMKTSTRTRFSFEAGMTRIGGHAIYADLTTTNIGKGELKDEMRCIAGYADIVAARVYNHADIEVIANSANQEGVPVINALSDKAHPLQTLADLMTMIELKANGAIKIAYVGDGNNVCNDLIIGASKAGFEISVNTPKGYEPSEEAVEIGKSLGKLHLYSGKSLLESAVKGADFVYTDTWISLGQEAETEKRMADFEGYKVTKTLLGDAYFMHCLPAHRGVEVTDEVIDLKSKSVVFEQAKNRMYAAEAVVIKLLSLA